MCKLKKTQKIEPELYQKVEPPWPVPFMIVSFFCVMTTVPPVSAAN